VCTGSHGISGFVASPQRTWQSLVRTQSGGKAALLRLCASRKRLASFSGTKALALFSLEQNTPKRASMSSCLWPTGKKLTCDINHASFKGHLKRLGIHIHVIAIQCIEQNIAHVSLEQTSTKYMLTSMSTKTPACTKLANNPMTVLFLLSLAQLSSCSFKDGGKHPFTSLTVFNTYNRMLHILNQY
jgi:hypothetical protein